MKTSTSKDSAQKELFNVGNGRTSNADRQDRHGWRTCTQLFLEEERNETDFVHSDCTIVAGWLGFPTNCIVAWLLLVSSGSRVSPPTMKMYSQ